MAGKTDFVEFNGIRMIAGWPEQIKKSLRIPTFSARGKEVKRIRHGDESENRSADARPCHDCGVIKKQYHVMV